MNAPADALLRLEHEHAETLRFERRGRRASPRGPRRSTTTSAARARRRPLQTRGARGSSTPQSEGFSGPGRPGSTAIDGAAVVARTERAERASLARPASALDDELAHHRDVGRMCADGAPRGPYAARARARRRRLRRRDPARPPCDRRRSRSARRRQPRAFGLALAQRVTDVGREPGLACRTTHCCSDKRAASADARATSPTSRQLAAAAPRSAQPRAID